MLPAYTGFLQRLKPIIMISPCSERRVRNTHGSTGCGSSKNTRSAAFRHSRPQPKIETPCRSCARTRSRSVLTSCSYLCLTESGVGVMKRLSLSNGLSSTASALSVSKRANKFWTVIQIGCSITFATGKVKANPKTPPCASRHGFVRCTRKALYRWPCYLWISPGLHRTPKQKGKPVQDLQVCDEEAAIVKEIFARTVSEQIGTTTLANDLNQRGLRTRAGAKFQCRTIKNILQNRAYLGYIIKRDVASPHIPILQIIDETTFEKANQILAKRSVATVQRRSIPRKGKPALLSGILFCGICGHRLSTSRPAENSRRNKTQYVCPICRKAQVVERGQSTYTAETVDSMVLRQTSTLLDLFTAHSEDSLRKTLEKKRKVVRQRLQEEKDRLESSKAELSKRENEVVRVLDGRSKYTAKELSALIHEQNTICNRLSGWVDRLNDQNQQLQYISRNLSFLYATVLSWKRILPTAAEEEQREILRELYQRVEIQRGYAINLNLTSNYSFFLSCTGKTKKSVCSVKP